MLRTVASTRAARNRTGFCRLAGICYDRSFAKWSLLSHDNTCPSCSTQRIVGRYAVPRRLSPVAQNGKPSVIRCPHCTAAFRDSPQLAGREVRCPSCDGSFYAPLQGIAQDGSADVDPRLPPEPPPIVGHHPPNATNAPVPPQPRPSASGNSQSLARTIKYLMLAVTVFWVCGMGLMSAGQFVLVTYQLTNPPWREIGNDQVVNVRTGEVRHLATAQAMALIGGPCCPTFCFFIAMTVPGIAYFAVKD